jgi:hypothetical protein
MKIPKFAFALLILAVVALASSLTVIGVAAHSSGNVLVLTPGSSIRHKEVPNHGPSSDE